VIETVNRLTRAAVGCPRCGRAVLLPVSAGLGEARVACSQCGKTFLSGDGVVADVPGPVRGLPTSWI
jgi:ribosomal protein S27AE